MWQSLIAMAAVASRAFQNGLDEVMVSHILLLLCYHIVLLHCAIVVLLYCTDELYRLMRSQTQGDGRKV